MQTGRIFSIEEFSTYDGPGIRMTVFLKGCPLRCSWCHNPEGQRGQIEIVRSPNDCLACGACLREGAKKTGAPCLVPESVAVCPRSLVRLCGEDVSVEQLVRIIEKNTAILNASGGGVTFSGGEPLLWADFLVDCFAALDGKTHRALQTCGYADADTFLRVLAHCDLVLFDLKQMDDEMHRRYTGVSNAPILENYRALAASDKPFLTRIPLIPTVNDTRENIEATARFMKECGADYVELLPYNTMAGGKYRMLGREYEPRFDGSILPDPHKEIWKNYGIEVTIL
ncbi:MAG: glycyl-radical enzyme activating protein [Clostridia bacterium]|nr:glycyl-radical enzyme activating protein [Clostridia bacterium]